MLSAIVIVAMIYSCSALFENCDKSYILETDATFTISYGNTLKTRNASSCRYTITAPANYIIESNCLVQLDQSESYKCPYKRLFISVDGFKDLRGSDYFCSRNGTIRTIRRRSIMSQIVIAYVAQFHDGTEKFTCSFRRISVRCDCGWMRRVS